MAVLVTVEEWRPGMEQRMTQITDSHTGFLGEAPVNEAAQRLFDADIESGGYVMNLTRMWAHSPALKEKLFAAIDEASEAAGLSFRQKGVLVAAAAATIQDSYCSLMWGTRLASASDPDTAAAVIAGDDSALDDEERVLADWARRIASDPNGISETDVDRLRNLGWSDDRILALTTYVGLRIAFSKVNDALGTLPDSVLWTKAPKPVLDAVAYGRPIAPDL
ncbi:MAG TPA: hypothetical protein VK070_13495 [Acidimicrobiia bacterium]|nr:hypothetical protein [Acidimicrobiia bacterium]